MSCDRCGRRTTRRHLCRDCGRDADHESRDTDTTEDTTKVQILTLECGDCEHEFEIEASERHKCPACGYDGVRCLDARDQEVLVA